jgi:MOSC domain-containing protein YiiM
MTATRTPVLLSVNVGLPRNVPWQGKTVYTGIWKYPVDGPAMVRRLNIDGDGQGDTSGHGGEQRAVLVYQIQSYRHWQEYVGRDDLSHGSFGENLTVDGLPDDEVCIGDRYRIGEAEFEVTQPRVTCYRVGLRLGEPELPALLVSHHRPGFYMRVITEGRILPAATCTATCNPAWSWTWPHPAATSSWTTAPARSCSSPRASASPRCWPCCTSSRRPAASARSGGCTGRADHTNIRSRPRHTPCWHPSRTPANRCSTVQPRPPDDTAATPPPGA